MNILGFDLAELLLRVPVLLFVLMVHEVSHGYVAMKLGDPTASSLGRLTLNPIKHLDPIGSLCMLFFGFGWAKPVPINTRYFKNPRRDMALTALAGPLSNFIMGFIGVFLFYLSGAILGFVIPVGFFGKAKLAWFTIVEIFIVMNISFGVFNMIPIPPLDGSRAFLTFLPPKYYFGIMKYERYIMLGLLILLYLNVLSIPLSYLVSTILEGMEFIVTLIPFLRP